MYVYAQGRREGVFRGFRNPLDICHSIKVGSITNFAKDSETYSLMQEYGTGIVGNAPDVHFI